MSCFVFFSFMSNGVGMLLSNSTDSLERLCYTRCNLTLTSVNQYFYIRRQFIVNIVQLWKMSACPRNKQPQQWRQLSGLRSQQILRCSESNNTTEQLRLVVDGVRSVSVWLAAAAWRGRRRAKCHAGHVFRHRQSVPRKSQLYHWGFHQKDTIWCDLRCVQTTHYFFCIVFPYKYALNRGFCYDVGMCSENCQKLFRGRPVRCGKQLQVTSFYHALCWKKGDIYFVFKSLAWAKYSWPEAQRLIF